MEIDDASPYHHVLEGLQRLRRAVKPRAYGSKTLRRRSARRLRSILSGMCERMKAMAKKGYAGMAQLLYTEIAGQGGLPIFRRMDAALRACERVPAVRGSSGSRESGPAVPRGRGRSGPRGRGGRARDMADIQCYNCYKFGHFRSSCPVQSSAAPEKQ